MDDIKTLEETVALAKKSLTSLEHDLVKARQSQGGTILDVPMNPERNDAKADSIRDYFKALLHELVSEQDGFSGKRPFGNSGWVYELSSALTYAGVVEGSVWEEDGDWEIECKDDDAAMVLIHDAIRAL